MSEGRYFEDYLTSNNLKSFFRDQVGFENYRHFSKKLILIFWGQNIPSVVRLLTFKVWVSNENDMLYLHSQISGKW